MEALNGIFLLCVKTYVWIHDHGKPHSTSSREVKLGVVYQTMVYLHNTTKQLKCMVYLKKNIKLPKTFQKIRFNAGLSIYEFYYEYFLNLLL